MEVHRVALTDASPEGENSAYVLPERGLVVDPGPPGERAWETLLAGVEASLGSRAAVTDVFVTHWHADHAGAATRLATACDATLHVHRDDAPLVGDYAAARERRVERDADRLLAWGVPEAVVERIREADRPSPLPATYPVETHGDGGTVAGLTVLHTPGHTLGHAALTASQGALFAGDALLPTYTPNVGGGDTRGTDPLGAYLSTLDRLERAAWTDGDRDRVTVYPGHGERVDYPDRVDTIREHHHERSERVAAAVRAADGPVTPWTVATELFGEMRGIHAKMGAGEAAAHLVHLVDRGRLSRVDTEPERYVPA